MVHTTRAIGYVLAVRARALPTLNAWKSGDQNLHIARWECDPPGAIQAPIAKRQGLIGALAAIAGQSASALVVTSRRDFGDVFDQIIVEEVIGKARAHVCEMEPTAIRPDEPGDLREIVRRTISTLAVIEQAVLAGRVQENASVKIARLTRFHGCPWGYRVAPDGASVEIDEGEQNVLAVVRHMHADGRKLREIVQFLGELGVVGRNGKPIGKTRVFAMASMRESIAPVAPRPPRKA